MLYTNALIHATAQHFRSHHVQAGDVLFIPEGYWHQISSAGGTIAVNLWFESQISGAMLDSNMSDFYLTRLLQSKVAEKVQELLAAIPKHAELTVINKKSAAGDQKGSLRYVQSLSMLF